MGPFEIAILAGIGLLAGISNAIVGGGPYNMAKAAQEASVVLDMETRLARASKTRVELRDPNANYNKWTVSELLQQTPATPWAPFLGRSLACTPSQSPPPKAMASR